MESDLGWAVLFGSLDGWLCRVWLSGAVSGFGWVVVDHHHRDKSLDVLDLPP
jgi:hypothetical protein